MWGSGGQITAPGFRSSKRQARRGTQTDLSPKPVHFFCPVPRGSAFISVIRLYSPGLALLSSVSTALSLWLFSRNRTIPSLVLLFCSVPISLGVAANHQLILQFIYVWLLVGDSSAPDKHSVSIIDRRRCWHWLESHLGGDLSQQPQDGGGAAVKVLWGRGLVSNSWDPFCFISFCF